MDKRAAMPNLDATLLLAKQPADNQFSPYGHFFDSRCGGRKLPFRYSKLACGLSVCLMAQALMTTAAHALEPTKPEGLTNANQSYDPNLGKSQIQSQEELEEALIALKLKKAVEQGMIDPSVLEDYQRETLHSPVPRPETQRQADSVIGSQTPPAREENESSEAIFERVFSDSSLQTNDNASNGLANAPVMQSPQQIEQALSQITPQVSRDFNKPVARLDATQPPLGFNTDLDASAQINPSNKKTLGITDEGATEEQLEGTKPVYEAKDVTVNPDSEEAKAAENAAHQAVKNTTIGKVDNKAKNSNAKSADEMVAEAQQNENGATEAGINPEDYLPEYQHDPNHDLTATIVEDPYQDEEDSEAKPGFIKGLYNRFFNDGSTALPKFKAKIYLQDQPYTGVAAPRLVRVSKETQPATNIKAAMENITVESISDFTAVTPKLHQAALNAAQAVGYYDIELSFKRVKSDEVAVIIEHLGDPVKVNTFPIIDIRGEGEDLAEFKAIQEESPLKEGEIFNHGEYKQTKQRIETTKDQFGFFDGQWLNKSVDVILPDNTADVDLVYDTGERYHFDKVVFFTVDKETGQLTTDPDKLPVKAELLHQLHRFEVGDDFYAPEVTRFTNDLSATRYFNSVNVETVRPNTSGATLGFENDGDEDILTDGDDPQLNEQANDQNSGGIQVDENGQPLDVQAMDDYAWDEEFAPIEYTVDQETSAKLENISAKAQRLSRLPDDRVLDETEEKAKSLLGKISNAVSDVVQQIFPDEKDPYADTSALPDDLSKTVLANRKTPQDVAQSKSVPLYVFVTADKPRDVDLGIGYGTDTGVRAVARMEHNLINRDGYQAGISVGASKINKSVSLQARRPWKHPLDDTLNANISYEQETINQGEGNLDLETNTIKGGLTRNIRNEGGWNKTYSARYRQDELESGVTGPDRENLPVPFNRDGAQFDQEAFLLGYQIDKTVTDNATNPTKGWRQYYSIEAGSDSVLSDTDMAIARAGVSGVYSFGEQNKHQVVASLDGGYIWAKDFEDVPYKLRFFAGGDRSIRGYDYNSLSAIEKGYLVGGQVLAVGSTEYNYEFKPGLRGAVFADVGNAYDTNFEAETKLGLGFGVRWASPVGMVRVDLAAGVLEDSIPVRLHFFIGSPLQ